MSKSPHADTKTLVTDGIRVSRHIQAKGGTIFKVTTPSYMAQIHPILFAVVIMVLSF